MNRVSVLVAPPSRSTASKYSSNLDRSWPPSASPNSLDHGLQVCTNIASKCISKLARLRPPSASLSYSITPSKGISKRARSRRPIASSNQHNHGLPVHMIIASKCISKLTPLWPPSAALSYSISASKCSSKLAQSRPPSSHDHSLQVHLQTCPIMASKLAET
jgi:hypothetical protein